MLTIVIPTYNRAVMLKKCLQSIFDQIDLVSGKVQVKVFDNQSNDDTALVIRDFIQQGMPIDYHRREQNVPADINIIKALTSMNEGYIWGICDDDFILPGKLATVLALLEQPDAPEFIYCNYTVFSKDLSEILQLHYLKEKEDRSFSSPSDFFGTLGTNLGFVSASICRASARYTNGFVEKHPSYWAPLALNCSRLSLLSRFYIIGQPILGYRANNSFIADWTDAFVTRAAMLFADLPQLGYSKKAVKRAITLHGWRFLLPYAANAVATGTDLREFRKKLWKTELRKSWGARGALLATYLPYRLMKRVKQLYQFCRNLRLRNEHPSSRSRR